MKWAFVTLGVGSVLTPSDLLCDFSFPSYVRFREGNMAHAQKSLPLPHSEGTICLVRLPNPLVLEVQIHASWGTRLHLPVTALALSALRRFAGWKKYNFTSLMGTQDAGKHKEKLT